MGHQYRHRHPTEDKIISWAKTEYDQGEINTPLRLQALVHRLAMGQALPEIKSDFPYIRVSALLHARAYFASQYPELYKPDYPQNFKVLVDENLDPHYATDGARRAFGEAAHVSFRNLHTKTDMEVWRYACANKFNMIVTKDRAVIEGRPHLDLTRCAHLKWKWRLQVNGGRVDSYLRRLPRIVHIKDADVDGRRVSAFLKAQRHRIAEIYEEAVSPVIEVTSGSAKSGIDYLELLYGKKNPKLEARISDHTSDILSELELGHLPPQEVTNIKKTVRNLVKLDMGGDFAKIPFRSEKKRRELVSRLVETEIRGRQVVYTGRGTGSFSKYVRAERSLEIA